jgi:AcrR family transcriptional regulator
MSVNKTEPRLDRRTAILDAAEEQFAKHGYDGVTLRAIARRAGVDLALPNYYFGPKRDLFDAVLFRRAEILNKARLDQLDQCLVESDQAPSVEAIIRAYLEPMLTGEQVEEEGWKKLLRPHRLCEQLAGMGRAVDDPVLRSARLPLHGRAPSRAAGR